MTLLEQRGGRYLAAGRTPEVRALLGFSGPGIPLPPQDDPLVVEAEQHEARMASHWLRLFSQEKEADKPQPPQEELHDDQHHPVPETV